MKTIIKKVLKWLYRKVIRDLVYDLVENPNSELDEKVMKILDDLFGYTPK